MRQNIFSSVIFQGSAPKNEFDRSLEYRLARETSDISNNSFPEDQTTFTGTVRRKASYCRTEYSTILLQVSLLVIAHYEEFRIHLPGYVCFRIASEEVLKNGREVPDKVVSGVNSPGNSCGGLCLV